jgi:hypothetical protein
VLKGNGLRPLADLFLEKLINAGVARKIRLRPVPIEKKSIPVKSGPGWPIQNACYLGGGASMLLHYHIIDRNAFLLTVKTRITVIINGLVPGPCRRQPASQSHFFSYSILFSLNLSAFWPFYSSAWKYPNDIS